MAARRRLPSGFFRQPIVKMTPVAREAIQSIQRLLASNDGAGLTPEQHLAECERLRIEAEAAQRKQGVLQLRGGA